MTRPTYMPVHGTFHTLGRTFKNIMFEGVDYILDFDIALAIAKEFCEKHHIPLYGVVDNQGFIVYEGLIK